MIPENTYLIRKPILYQPSEPVKYFPFTQHSLSFKLDWLEKNGFELWFDSLEFGWEIINEDEDYYLIGMNKEELIKEAFDFLNK